MMSYWCTVQQLGQVAKDLLTLVGKNVNICDSEMNEDTKNSPRNMEHRLCVLVMLAKYFVNDWADFNDTVKK